MKRTSLNFTGYETFWGYPKTNKPTPFLKWIKVGQSSVQVVTCKVKRLLWWRPTTVPGTHRAFFFHFTHHNSSQHLGFLHSIMIFFILQPRTCICMTGAVSPLLEVADLQSTEKPNCGTRCQRFFSQAVCFRKLLQSTNIIYERRATWN